MERDLDRYQDNLQIVQREGGEDPQGQSIHLIITIMDTYGLWSMMSTFLKVI